MREIFQILLLLFFVSFVSFVVLYFLPGSSDIVNAGLEHGRSSAADYFVTQYSFSELMSKYSQWLGNALTGDFGNSLYSKKPVIEVIFPRWLLTMTIAIISMAISVALAVVWCWIPVAIKNKISRNYIRPKDEEATVQKNMAGKITSNMPSKTPERIIGRIMAIFEQALLSFIPLSLAVLILGIATVWRLPLLELRGGARLVLPIITLVILLFPRYIHSLQASIRQAFAQSYVDFARSLGYSYTWVWWREVLPNALPFTLSLSIVQLSYLVGGSIVVEKIFLVPGLGSLLVDAVLSRDRPVVQAIVLISSAMVGILHSVFVIFNHRMYRVTNEHIKA